MEVECSATAVLVPRRMKMEWPIMTLFHRAQTQNFVSGGIDGPLENTTTGGLGHYEALVMNASNDDGTPRWSGCFNVGDEVHAHLHRICTRILAAQYNDIARCRMEVDYNSQSSVVRYSMLNSVGLRVGKASKAGKRRQARVRTAYPVSSLE